jgi:hypothetical protein
MESGEQLRPSVPSTTSGLSPRALRILGLVVVLVGALVVVGIVAARSYGPIEAGGGLLSPRPVGGVDYRYVHQIGLEPKDAYAVDARRPGSFGLSFEIENRGRLPLTFEEPPEKPGFVLQQDIRISSVPIEGDPRAGTEIPIAGATLEPGERRRLHVRFSWKAFCAGEGSGGSSFLTPAGAEVRYRGLFVFRRTQTVEMPSDVVFVCGMDLRRLADSLVAPPP